MTINQYKPQSKKQQTYLLKNERYYVSTLKFDIRVDFEIVYALFSISNYAIIRNTT